MERTPSTEISETADKYCSTGTMVRVFPLELSLLGLVIGIPDAPRWRDRRVLREVLTTDGQLMTLHITSIKPVFER